MNIVIKKEYVRKTIALVLISVTLTFCFAGFAYAESNRFLDVTAGAVVNDIKIGWNLGNSLDSHSASYEQSRPNSLSLETAWGNPKVTKELIDYVAEQGFNAIRIPVSWYYNTTRDDEGRLVINPAWLARVKEVVDYAMDNSMYTIIDSHHDSHFDKNVTLLFYTDVEEEEMSGVLEDARTLWTQIAEYFKDYNEKLIFESFNEVNSKVTNFGFRYSQRAVRQMNELNQTFVSAVRATGGNNAGRVLMLQTAHAGYTSPVLNDFVLPEDTAAQKLIVSVHCYSKKYGEDIEAELEEIADFSARVNAPVIIGEFGTRIEDFTSEHRQKLAANYVARAASHGIKCFWWDDNKSKAYRIINRQELSESDFGMIRALMEGAQGNANVLPDTQVLNTSFHFVRGFVCLNELTYEGKQYYKGDVLYKTGSSWGVTSNPIQVTAGEYYNVSLKSCGKLYEIPLNCIAFYDNEGKYLSCVDLRADFLPKYSFCLVPDGAATMRVCIYAQYKNILMADFQTALAQGDIELRVSSAESQPVIIPAAPFRYDSEVAVEYSVAANGVELGKTVKCGANNVITFQISSKPEIQDGMLVCAVYSDGREALRISHTNVSVAKGSGTAALSIDVPPDERCTVKAFLWKQSSLTPLIQAISLKG